MKLMKKIGLGCALALGGVAIAVPMATSLVSCSVESTKLAEMSPKAAENFAKAFNQMLGTADAPKFQVAKEQAIKDFVTIGTDKIVNPNSKNIMNYLESQKYPPFKVLDAVDITPTNINLYLSQFEVKSFANITNEESLNTVLGSATPKLECVLVHKSSNNTTKIGEGQPDAHVNITITITLTTTPTSGQSGNGDSNPGVTQGQVQSENKQQTTTK